VEANITQIVIDSFIRKVFALQQNKTKQNKQTIKNRELDTSKYFVYGLLIVSSFYFKKSQFEQRILIEIILVNNSCNLKWSVDLEVP
jgi:hypothetical protein